MIRTHWLLFNMQTSLITPFWLVPECLTPVRGSFSPGLWNAEAFQSSRQSQGIPCRPTSGDGMSTSPPQSSKAPSRSLCTARCTLALLTLLSNSCSLFLEKGSTFLLRKLSLAVGCYFIPLLSILQHIRYPKIYSS